MGSPESPNGDDIPQIIHQLIDETLTSRSVGNEEDGLSTPEQPGYDPLQESRTQARNAWKDLSRHLEAGHTISHDTATTVGLLLYTLISDAVERRDAPHVKEYVSALDGLTIRRDIKAAGYVRAMQAGYSAAETTLRAALLEEWSSAPLETHGNPDPATVSPVLQTTVQIYQQTGEDPQFLINEYSLSPAHALQLRLLQLKQLRGVAEHADRVAIEEHVADDFVGLSTTNTLAIAKQAIETVADPWQRLRMLRHTLDVIEASGQAQGAEVQQLVEKAFGELLWSDPSGDDPTLRRMAQTVEANRHGRNAPFVDAWEIDQRIFSGETPAQIVEFIDRRTAPALSASGFGIEAEIALTNRDTLLQRYATAYAAHGNLEGAKLCLAGIGNSRVHEAALHACIGHSSTPEELRLLQPQGLPGGPEGPNATSFILAMADYNGDTEGLCTIAMDLARETAAAPDVQRQPRRIAAPTAQLSSFLNEGKRTLYLYTAFKQVESQDPLRSYQLAKDLLVLLRSNDNPQNAGVVQFLSDALVRDGDSSELRSAFEALPKDQEGNRPLRSIIRLLNLQSTEPIPEWLRIELDFACD